MSQNYILVGNKFETFASNSNVTTLLKFAADLEDGNIGACRVIRGQGVSDSWMAHILELAQRNGTPLTMDDPAIPARAASRASHKVKRQNILISEPTPASENAYDAHLLIDEDCELMGDHQSGHHLQGMLLVEAARQMFLAVIERFLRPGKRNYAVINYMNSTFQRFAFPIATDIRLTIDARKDDRSDRGGYDATIVFSQNKAPVTTITARFTVFDSETLSVKESSMSSDCVRSLARPDGLAQAS